MQPTFEELFLAISRLQLSATEVDRRVHWLDANSVVGVARQATGRIEIFIVGEALVAGSSIVQRHLRCDTWTGNSCGSFVANRVVLPADEHFVASAAFLVEELFRNEVLRDLPGAFRKCEPIIELFLKRLTLDEQTVQGLFGELLLLEVGLQLASTKASAIRILNGWHGWAAMSRDFTYADLAIEVKSTGGLTSKHAISHLEQVNCKKSATGEQLERLYLVSIGLHRPESGGRSLPDLVDEILERLDVLSNSDSSLRNDFLHRLEKYGVDGRVGYLHEEMKDWDAYSASFVRTFLRIYDMADPAVKVLRFEDVANRTHTPSSSITFEVDLPMQVDGDINPTGDLRKLMLKAL